MPARYLFAAFVLAIALAPSLASAQADCDAPEPVCAARGAVFALSSPFDPLASAVLVAPGELVTNRHVVADETRIALRLADGRRIEGEVVPGAYRGDLVLVRVPGLSGTPRAGSSPSSPRAAKGATTPSPLR
ncbi:MAG: trypsin-like peptidase domain-containing protein, partial [Alphaproteobacteria bacterium]